VRYLRQAADAAVRQSAHREAVGYLRRAAAAVERLPEAERAEHELDVLMSLGVNLQVTAGFAAPEVRSIHARVFDLCKTWGEIGDAGSTAPKPPDVSRRMFRVLWGVWLFHKVRSDLREASDMARRLLAMGRESADPNLMVQAHQAMCVTALCLGDPRTTHAHMELAAAIYDPVREAANAERFGQDPGVATLAFGAVALWLMDREEEALAAAARSVELARRLNQPSSLALASHFTAMLHQCRGDATATAKWAQDNIALSAEEGFSFWMAGGHVLHGWAMAMQEKDGSGHDAAVAEIRQGLAAWADTGSRTYQTYFVGLLADALLHLDRSDEALSAVNEALESARALPEGLYEAELHRLEGRCLLKGSAKRRSEARESFAQAVAVAAAQQAKSFEKRAVADLAALSRRAGR
jgi:adenylate cyclase